MAALPHVYCQCREKHLASKLHVKNWLSWLLSSIGMQRHGHTGCKAAYVVKRDWVMVSVLQPSSHKAQYTHSLSGQARALLVHIHQTHGF